MRPCRAYLPQAAALAFTLASPAWASAYPECTKTPTESEVSAAKGAFEAGQVSFHEGDYDRAVLYWEDAFQRDCTAIALLLNLARAYELAHHYDRSVSALEAYLERNPRTEDRVSIEKRIARLSGLKSNPPAPQAEKQTTAEAKEEPVAPPPPAEAVPPSRPIWPVILTGGGVVATGVGIGLTWAGQSAVNGYTNGLCAQKNAAGAFQCGPEIVTDPDTGESTTLRSASEVERDAQNAASQRNIGIVVTSVGAAAAVGGAVAWWLLWREAPEETALTPIVSPERFGIVLSGRF